ncbi:Histone H2A.Z-specific chaperone [Termitomyces sp. T159_Od127]|nr:Histone H2A.Z-specific chaperone [Termitomyces sp. T159_Od127]
MSSSATDPKDTTTTGTEAVASPDTKGKGKAPAADESMEVEEDDEEDDDDEDGEDDEEDAEETYEEIDPSAILSTGRRTRGVKVDYTSKEALERAGLADEKDDDDDDDVVMKD